MTTKTSATLAESATYERDSLEQTVDQYHMIGSVFEPGLVDEILATDPTAQLGWLGLSAAMAQAQIELDPCGCKPEIFNFINEMLFKRLETRFQQVFINSLQALLYGVAPAELSLSWEFGHWTITDISSRPARGFDLYNLKKRSGEFWISGTYSWYTSDTSLKRVQCGAPGDRDRALIWWPVFGPGLLGRSLLRPIVNEHREKSLLRKLRGQALSKVLFGTSVLHARPRSSEDDPLSPAEIQAAQTALAKATSGSATCLYLPDSFDLPTVLYSQSDGLGKSIEVEQALDLQILMALGSSHLARGLLSGYGSQGAGDLDQQLQDSIRSYYFQWFSEQIQPLIDYIVDLNWGPQKRYPELKITSPSVMSIPQLSRTLAQLTAAGLYSPCKADEQVLRRLCRMPEQTGEPINSPLQDQNSDQKPGQSPETGLGIKGHYNPLTGVDTRIDRDVYYQEAKDET